VLKTHGRYAYSAIVERPPYDWPNGARLAAYVAVNLEQFPFGEGLGPELNPRQPEPDVVNHSWRDWGNRVGVWRLLELFDAHAVPCAALANAALYDHCPQVLAAFRRRGDEIVGHGRTNAERQSEMDEPAERAMIEEVTARIARAEGRPPAGWLGPWVSETRVTPDLLEEAGYRYLLDWGHDDQPVWLRTRSGGRILSVPYPRPTNDLPLMHGAKAAPSVWADILIDQFDEMLEQSRRQPLVFNLSLHPYLTGHAFRLRQLRRVVERIAGARERIWLTRPGEIAAHARALPDGVVP
jgi:peptidoglycan/xylan/chitin deacetylase (PgdA/CDA1 family)